MAACLPPDLIPSILSWLPVKSLLCFKCVCKGWLNLIDTPFFHQLHLQHSLVAKQSLAFITCCSEQLSILDDLDSPDPNLTEPSWLPDKYKWPIGIDSCNGLLCYIAALPFVLTDCNFYVCNPSMRTFKKLPMIEHPSLQIMDICWGFNYDSKIDDYKIVVIDGLGKDMFVYRLREELWRHCPQCAVNDVTGFKYFTGSEIALVMNNRLHWIFLSENWEIARFNLSSEEWDESLNLPAYLAKTAMAHHLNILEGCVCLTMMVEGQARVEVWTMNEYGAQESWSKLFSAPHDMSCLRVYPISYSKDGSKILLSRGFSGGLFWYDPEKETITESDMINKQVRVKGYFKFVVYAQSLVSIPNGTTSTPISQA